MNNLPVGVLRPQMFTSTWPLLLQLTQSLKLRTRCLLGTTVLRWCNVVCMLGCTW